MFKNVLDINFLDRLMAYWMLMYNKCYFICTHKGKVFHYFREYNRNGK